MAKKSAIEKNLRRMKLVKKYAKKRAALKKIIKNKKLELSERFAAQLKLNKLPKIQLKLELEIVVKYLVDLTGFIENLKSQELHLGTWLPLVKFRE